MGKTERSKWAGAHESMWATSEFQLSNSESIREKCAAQRFSTILTSDLRLLTSDERSLSDL